VAAKIHGVKRVPLDIAWLVLLGAICALAYSQRSAAVKTPAPPMPVVERDIDPAPVAFERQMRLEVDNGTFAGSALNRDAVELARAGRYSEAAAKLRKALAATPGNALVQRNLQAVLLAWGFEELQREQARAAADRFTEALAFGRSADVLTGLGIAQVRGRQYGEGITALEEAIERGAKDGATYLALGQAYEAIDDRVRALEMLQRAREAGVRAAELEERIQRLAREVDAEWDFTQESSRHFQVRFDAGEDKHAANEVLRSLESAYDVVGRKLGYFPDRPTPVVLYAERDFHDITQTPDWAGAVFDGRLKFPVRGLVAGADLDRVTRHEYAHSLIAALANTRLPAWLNEGLAMWAEEESPGDRRDWADQVLATHELMPLATLSQPFAGLPRQHVQAAYAQSYVTVLFLVDEYDARRLPRFLEAMRHGASMQQAFADVYPVDLAAFEEAAAKSIS